MINQEIEEYILANIERYPINALRRQLFKQGFSTKEIDEAVANVEGIELKEKKLNKFYRQGLSILFVFFVIVGGLALFLFYENNKEVDCGTGIYLPEKHACAFDTNLIGNKIDCREGIYNNLKNVCEVKPEFVYLCADGKVLEIDGKIKCVIEINASDMCEDDFCSFLEQSTGLCPADCEFYCGDKICDSTEAESGMCITDCINDNEENDSCGDRICSSIEKNDNVCPEDCENNSLVPNATLKSNDSPFGIKESFEYYNLIEDIGIDSIRYGGIEGVNWALVESKGIEEKSQFFGWSWNDNLFKETYEKGIEMSVVLQAEENPVQTDRLDEYSAFVSSAIERYDGDGINDAEGSPVVTYWEIENEPDMPAPENYYFGSPKDYALALKTAYNAIKSASPNANVAIGSLAINLEYFEQILAELENLKDSEEDLFFDTFNLHIYGQDYEYGRNPITGPGGTQDGPSISEVKALLAKYGYSDIGFIITETGTFSGTGVNNITQTERNQAVSLIKRYVYLISEGVEGIYWFQIKYAQHLSTRGDFAKISLIDRDGNKKLSYYTYKNMVEILDGSNWDNVQTIQESDNIYIYKFTKNDKPIWVVWNDNPQEKQATVSGISSIQVKITEAVPKYELGKEITDYSTAFNTESKTVQNQQITLTLNNIPLFIE